MKVLLAVSDSLSSEAAIQMLKRLPLPKDSSVMVVSVAKHDDLSHLQRFADPEEAAHFDQWRSDFHAAAEAIVAKASAELEGDVGMVQSQVVSGHITDALLEMVDDLTPDLLVVGASNSSTVERMFRAGVSDKLVHHARCSVLLARPAHPADGDSSSVQDTQDAELAEMRRSSDLPLHVLLAHDGSPMADEAVNLLHQLDLSSVHVTVLTVLTVGTTLYRHDVLERLSKSWQAYKHRSQEALEQLCTDLGQTAGRVDSKLIDGGPEPEDEILELAKELGVDLILLGSTGRTGMQRFLLGSTAGRVVHHAPCSVWVSRPQ